MIRAVLLPRWPQSLVPERRANTLARKTGKATALTQPDTESARFLF
jgi:hypothetical protein